MSFCLLVFSVRRKGAKPIETTADPPHRSSPIDPPPIETITDPPPILHRSSKPPSILYRSKPPPFEGKVQNHHRSKPPPSLCLLVFFVTEEGSKKTTDGNPPQMETHHQGRRFLCPSILLYFDSSVDRFFKSSQFHGESLDSSVLLQIV